MLVYDSKSLNIYGLSLSSPIVPTYNHDYLYGTISNTFPSVKPLNMFTDLTAFAMTNATSNVNVM